MVIQRSTADFRLCHNAAGASRFFDKRTSETRFLEIRTRGKMNNYLVQTDAINLFFIAKTMEKNNFAVKVYLKTTQNKTLKLNCF